MPGEFYSSGVQLWDKNGASASLNNGSGLLLHPETELRYVKPDVGGGLSSSVNSLWFDPAAAMSSGLETVVSSKFCPLEKVVNNTTQYADMYTTNAQATVTELPGSTGYGTLVNVIQTIDHVRPVASATNAYIPTEHAVALALSEKQDVLVQGACLTISQSVTDPTKTDIAVNTKYTVNEYLANCSTNAVPTEYAVREAIEVASAAIDADVTILGNSITTVSSSVNSLTTVVNNINNWGTATTASYGVVTLQNTVDTNTGASLPTASAIKDYVDQHTGKPTSQGSGITVDDANGSYTIKLNNAGTASIGGVSVPANQGLVLNNGALNLDIATANHIGGVLVTNNGPISINSITGALNINLADSTQSGIVYVPAGSGLSAAVGRLTAVTASSYADYTTASAGTIGAVKVVKAVTSTATAEYLNSGYVPSVQAVYDFVVSSGGKAVVEGTGIDVSTATNSYTVSLEKATNATLGGVIVPAAGGIGIDANASITLSSARYVDTSTGSTSNGVSIPFGGARVWNSGGIITDNGVLRLSGVDETVDASNGSTYVINNSTYYAPLGGVRVWKSGGVAVEDSVLRLSEAPVVADYQTGYTKVTAKNLGGVACARTIASGHQDWQAYAVVPTVQAVYDYVENHSAAYTGPFAATYTDTSEDYTHINVSGGFVKWLDGQLEVPASTSIPLPYNSFLYLTGSSGTVDGQEISSVTYQIESGTSVWSKTTIASNNRYKWVAVSGNTLGSRWLPDAVPSSGTLMYASATASNVATSGGTVTGIVEYSLKTYENPDITYNMLSVASDNAESRINGYQWCYGTATLVTAKRSFVLNDARVYSTGIVESGRYAWNHAGGGDQNLQWTTAASPVAGDPVYRYSTGTDQNGVVASPADAGIEIGPFVFTCSYSTTNNTYYDWVKGAYPDDEHIWTFGADLNEGAPVYGAPGLTAVIGTLKNVVAYSLYTSAGLPDTDTKTMPVVGDYDFRYTTTQPALPPAGRFYTMIAKNVSASDDVSITQHQYGTVWHEHWGDDYKGQFGINRITINQSAADDAVVGSYPYKYQVNGGRIYGGFDFKRGRLWQGSIISGGVVLAPGDAEYPSTVVSGTPHTDALYFPYGGTNEVWLNIWSGTWPTTYGGPGGSTKAWHTVVHSVCLEGYIQNCYSVQLGWVTVNGAPQQEHKGAVAIRGRWT